MAQAVQAERDIRGDPRLSAEMGRGPAEEGAHPECTTRPRIQPCCLASANIYSLVKNVWDFFFNMKTMRLINLY